MEKVNVAEKLALFNDYWNPRIVAELNGRLVKVVKLKGPFVWHEHAGSHALLAGWWAGAFLGVCEPAAIPHEQRAHHRWCTHSDDRAPHIAWGGSRDALKRALGAGAPAARLGHVSRVTSDSACHMN